MILLFILFVYQVLHRDVEIAIHTDLQYKNCLRFVCVGVCKGHVWGLVDDDEIGRLEQYLCDTGIHKRV